jgi:hypothetical protein
MKGYKLPVGQGPVWRGSASRGAETAEKLGCRKSKRNSGKTPSHRGANTKNRIVQIGRHEQPRVHPSNGLSLEKVANPCTPSADGEPEQIP